METRLTDLLRNDATHVITAVVEAQCPLCRTELRVHDDRACCPCCGDSYRVAADQRDVKRCPPHGRRCEHWEAIWSARSPAYIGDTLRRTSRARHSRSSK